MAWLARYLESNQKVLGENAMLAHSAIFKMVYQIEELNEELQELRQIKNFVTMKADKGTN